MPALRSIIDPANRRYRGLTFDDYLGVVVPMPEPIVTRIHARGDDTDIIARLYESPYGTTPVRTSFRHVCHVCGVTYHDSDQHSPSCDPCWEDYLDQRYHGTL